MRVIGGEFRSRLLKTLHGLDVRPTPDRLREALFNILAPRIEGAVFADLYAGTGAVGIEALSRGARKAIFVEQKPAAVRVIHENLKALGIAGRAEVHQAKAAAMIPRIARHTGGELGADIVFLDPPFPLENEFTVALTLLGERAPALVLVQHPPRLKLEDGYGALHRIRRLKQGDNEISFYRQA
jgi:16S rRNA (guanine(966)-N(2))-methyltransferase RsmD